MNRIFLLLCLISGLCLTSVVGFGQTGKMQFKFKPEIGQANLRYTLYLNEEVVQTGVTDGLDNSFILSPLLPGKHDLKVKLESHKTVEVKGIQVYADQTRFLFLPLEFVECDLDQEIIKIQWEQPKGFYCG